MLFNLNLTVPKWVGARSSKYGLPQSRERVYVILIDESLADDAVMTGFSHIVTSVLPDTMQPQTTLQQVRAYVATALEALDQVPTEHAPSKDLSDSVSQMRVWVLNSSGDLYGVYSLA